ncbi:hypothetical protein C0Q70_00222 [Pomacea canaliculata]|uniref:Tox-ART-HYD1 domain-containing protein n=1 Tax=Pomacea canaliculata TaxID=400727 RepID=A0A2T7PW15_POMCA|nr:hypothetical protein C0Q70_00222 [Pomacea canaliculata]
MGNWFSDHVDFYHYTSESGIDAIMDSGYIKESQTGGPDAFFGSGVYGTSLPPSVGKREIANNNWKEGWRSREHAGRVDYVIKLHIPSTSLKEFKTPTRQVYLHPGRIHLDDYSWEILEV